MSITFKARFVVPSILFISSLSSQTMGAQGWQEGRLLSPTATQQRLEQRGKVFIYDGLHEKTVEQALDTQFDRVQHMMFVGTRHADSDGEEYADDDC
jgi:hypothetical protein